jgi:hypothetical protein
MINSLEIPSLGAFFGYNLTLKKLRQFLTFSNGRSPVGRFSQDLMMKITKDAVKSEG